MLLESHVRQTITGQRVEPPQLCLFLLGTRWTFPGGHPRGGQWSGKESKVSRRIKPGSTWSGRSSRVLWGGGWRQQSAVGAADVPLPSERQVSHMFALHGLDTPSLRILRMGRGHLGSCGGAERWAVSRAGARPWAVRVVSGRPPGLSGPGRPLLARAGGGRLAAQARPRGAGRQAQELGQHQILLPQQPTLVVCSVALSFGNKLKKRYWKKTHIDQVLESFTLGHPQQKCTSGKFSSPPHCPQTAWRPGAPESPASLPTALQEGPASGTTKNSPPPPWTPGCVKPGSEAPPP